MHGDVEPNQVSNWYRQNAVGRNGKVYYWDMIYYLDCGKVIYGGKKVVYLHALVWSSYGVRGIGK